MLNKQLQSQGFCVVHGVIAADEVVALRRALNFPQYMTKAGVRHLNQHVPAINALARSEVLKALIIPIIGKQAGLVRALFFNKSDKANWNVGWHQDRTIAVKQRVAAAGFTGWSIKDTIPHVQAPAEILATMLSCRIHLDDANEENGALHVIPGSHQHGNLHSSGLKEQAQANGSVLCTVNRGDVLLMRPLLAHASSKSTVSKPRRVIHLDYASKALPYPLQWWEKVDFF